MVHLRPVQENPHQGLREGHVQPPPRSRTQSRTRAAAAGTAFSYQFPLNTFNDADTGDTLTYTATKADGNDLPTWLGFTASTRTFSGTPQAADVETVSVKVTASDGTASVSDEFNIGVAGTTCNAPDLAGRTQIWTNTVNGRSEVRLASFYGYSFASPDVGSLNDGLQTQRSAQPSLEEFTVHGCTSFGTTMRRSWIST